MVSKEESNKNWFEREKEPEFEQPHLPLCLLN